jgi:hypothetical protein
MADAQSAIAMTTFPCQHGFPAFQGASGVHDDYILACLDLVAVGLCLPLHCQTPLLENDCSQSHPGGVSGAVCHSLRAGSKARDTPCGIIARDQLIEYDSI